MNDFDDLLGRPLCAFHFFIHLLSLGSSAGPAPARAMATAFSPKVRERFPSDDSGGVPVGRLGRFPSDDSGGAMSAPANGFSPKARERVPSDDSDGVVRLASSAQSDDASDGRRGLFGEPADGATESVRPTGSPLGRQRSRRNSDGGSQG